MPRFFNPNVYPNPNMQDNTQEPDVNNYNCNCKRMNCPTIYKECPPIVTCSKQVIDQYHITKQPYIHNYHTEVVHHHIVQNEFIPKYSCSEVHVNDGCNNDFNQ